MNFTNFAFTYFIYFMDYKFLNDYQENLQRELLRLCSSNSMLSGTLLASENIDYLWDKIAPEYMADAVKEIQQYPMVSVAWAAFIGMAIAQLWDTDWQKGKETEYTDLYGERGFDDMDEHILYDIIGFDTDSAKAKQVEDMIRQCADCALSHIRHSAVEPQSPTAFHIFARTCKVMYRIGASIQLYRLGYKYDKINLN